MKPIVRSLFIASTLLFTAAATAQVEPAYALFNAKGKPLSHKALMKQAGAADVVLFGELHNSAIAHWLQLMITRELAAAGPLVLGAEMIERDDQTTLDRYLRGEIDQAAFDTLARLWKNHPSDYKPLVDLAKERSFPFVATNVPRRYARAVNRGDFAALDTVPENERAWIAPLPIAFDPELPRYVFMLGMMGDHASPTIVKAQALKDATMAYSIAERFLAGTRFVHYHGSFHSDFFEGINWYLNRLRPELKRFNIATVTQSQLKTLDADNLGRADVIIVVHEDVPGTY